MFSDANLPSRLTLTPRKIQTSAGFFHQAGYLRASTPTLVALRYKVLDADICSSIGQLSPNVFTLLSALAVLMGTSTL